MSNLSPYRIMPLGSLSVAGIRSLALTSPAYDRIVLGVGGIGSSALLELARRGARVLGLEQFEGAHDRGSSHGQTRIIRQAYFEHPDYVPLLKQAYIGWERLEQEAGESLFARVGLLEMGPPDGVLIPGVRESARIHGLPLEGLSRDEVRRRFPAFEMHEGMECVFEQNAGVLFVERCIEAAVRRAQVHGAELRWNERVVRISFENRSVTVETNRGRYSAGGLVCCLGAWSCPALPVALPLRVVRKHLHWLAAQDSHLAADRGCPAFFYEVPEGYFYGFPAFDHDGVKVAEHSGGETVLDPSAVDRSLDHRDLTRVQDFTRLSIPSLSGVATRHAVCMYTLTPDEHFIVDRIEDHPSVVYAAGLSGHGFKFATALGGVLATMSLENTTPREAEFLSLKRFPR